MNQRPEKTMNPVYRHLLVLGLALTAWSAHAADAVPARPAAVAPTTARLIPAGSEVTFVARQLGVPLDGRFKRFDAQIALDPRQPQNGRVAFQIDLGSVSINAETDSELAQGVWFDTQRFPKATFVSSAIRPAGPGRFDVAGTLTIKGQARPLTVPVSLAQSKGTTTATGGFVLKRLDFKIGDGDWADPSVVANEVQVRFKLNLQGLPPL